MNVTESALRSIKDRVAASLGEIDEASAKAHTKGNHSRLWNAALELHKCADELQTLLIRIKTR